MADGDFLGVAKILPFDSTTGAVLLARYEGKDPVSITAEEAETLIRNQAELKSAADGKKR
jgi:hypothetical protein